MTPLIIDGQPCEHIIRHAATVEWYGGWPVSTWDGASGERIARTLDGARWYRGTHSGYSGPMRWERIATPSVQPAIGGQGG